MAKAPAKRKSGLVTQSKHQAALSNGGGFSFWRGTTHQMSRARSIYSLLCRAERRLFASHVLPKFSGKQRRRLP
jgi:hypothetical protein